MSLNLVSPFTIFPILLGFGFGGRLWVVFGVHVDIVVIEGCVVHAVVGAVNVVVWEIKAIFCAVVVVVVVVVVVDGVQVVVDFLDVFLRVVIAVVLDVQCGFRCCSWVKHVSCIYDTEKKGKSKNSPSNKINFSMGINLHPFYDNLLKLAFFIHLALDFGSDFLVPGLFTQKGPSNHHWSIMILPITGNPLPASPSLFFTPSFGTRFNLTADREIASKIFLMIFIFCVQDR